VSDMIEASAIAEWIIRNKVSLETKYAKPIHEIIGVVTPFGGQASAISSECIKSGIPVGKAMGEMTVGTVHSLQGAERSVVIFSPTYSRDADGSFIDRSASMLNVAVSRAKDSFVVFGDMSIFNQSNKGTPRGLLASFLFADEQNAISLHA
jgi:superfamily I DNA and/or RNA helicase